MRVWYLPVLSLTRCMQARNKGPPGTNDVSLSLSSCCPSCLRTRCVEVLLRTRPRRKGERERRDREDDGTHCVLRPSLCVCGRQMEYLAHCAPAVRGGWCPRSTGVRVQYIYQGLRRSLNADTTVKDSITVDAHSLLELARMQTPADGRARPL